MTDSNKSKAVIFDLDGVLVDTGQYHKQSWYDLAERENIPMNEDFFYETFGMQNQQIIPLLFGRDVPQQQIDEMSAWKEKRYRELITGKMELLEGVKALIEDLRANGFALAIGTSTPKINLDFMMAQMPLDGCFDEFATGEDAPNGKPAPDTFLSAAKKLGIAPENCVVVEDAVAGVEAGKAAGMAVLAVTTTRPRKDLCRADMVVDNLAQVTAKDFDKLLNLAC